MTTLCRAARLLALAASLSLLAGCHSAFIQATVTNHAGQVIHLFEVDYPTASFGGSELAPGATFHYRFKVLGNGTTKLLWTDAGRQEHTARGPDLQEGLEGTLGITILPNGASWDPHLHTP